MLHQERSTLWMHWPTHADVFQHECELLDACFTTHVLASCFELNRPAFAAILEELGERQQLLGQQPVFQHDSGSRQTLFRNWDENHLALWSDCVELEARPVLREHFGPFLDVSQVVRQSERSTFAPHFTPAKTNCGTEQISSHRQSRH